MHHLLLIILSAKSDSIDRVLGLELDADDYLAKPCNARELLARLRAVSRRTSEALRPNAETLTFGALKVNQKRRELT